MSEHSELWKKYRPTCFDEVVGQDTAVGLLRSYLKADKVPHALLLTGPSGVGKSTLAHILAKEMGCYGLDLNVIDCASIAAPMETIRDLQQQMRTSPSAKSTCRIWILEELQSWSRAGFAQQSMLLMLEDASVAMRKSYVFACTTNPEKLKEAIRNRCKKIVLTQVAPDGMRKLLLHIAKCEGREVPDNVVEQIISDSYGSPREAVNQLDSALTAGTTEEVMLRAIGTVGRDDPVWRLMKLLFWDKPDWRKVAETIREVAAIATEPEKVRHRILAIAAGEMLKGGKKSSRAYLIADVFSRNWYDCAESGLVRSCWTVVQGD